MFSLYLVLISLLLSKGHTQITDVSLSEFTEITSAVTSSEISTTSISNDETTQSTNDSTTEATESSTAITSTDTPNNGATSESTAIMPSSILNNDQLPTSEEANLQHNAISNYNGNELMQETERDKVVMAVISNVSNYVLAAVIFFKITKCILPNFVDFTISTLKPMAPTVLLMPMQVAGNMLEFTLGPIVTFLVVALTPLTFIMRLTLTPIFGRMGNSVNFLLQPVMSFLGTYLNRALFPVKVFAEFADKYWIDPIFGPLFKMIDVFLDPLAKMLAKLLGRLAPLIELVDPLLEPMLSITSSLAPLLRMFPGASTLLKTITILFGRKRINVSFLTKLLSTFDPDMFTYETYE